MLNLHDPALDFVCSRCGHLEPRPDAGYGTTCDCRPAQPVVHRCDYRGAEEEAERAWEETERDYAYSRFTSGFGW